MSRLSVGRLYFFKDLLGGCARVLEWQKNNGRDTSQAEDVM